MTEIIKIPGTKINLVKKFYEELFKDKDEEVLVVVKPDNEEEKEVTHYIIVDDVDKYIKRIKELGGEIVVDKTAVPRMGYFIEAKDPEGHYFGLWEENENAELE